MLSAAAESDVFHFESELATRQKRVENAPNTIVRVIQKNRVLDMVEAEFGWS